MGMGSTTSSRSTLDHARRPLHHPRRARSRRALRRTPRPRGRRTGPHRTDGAGSRALLVAAACRRGARGSAAGRAVRDRLGGASQGLASRMGCPTGGRAAPAWTLRGCTEAIAVHRRTWRSIRRSRWAAGAERDFERHRWWFVIDGLGFLVTSVFLGPFFLLIPALPICLRPIRVPPSGYFLARGCARG